MTDKEIEDAISRWHEDGDETRSLHEYLGWTWEEYKRWGETDVKPIFQTRPKRIVKDEKEQL